MKHVTRLIYIICMCYVLFYCSLIAAASEDFNIKLQNIKTEKEFDKCLIDLESLINEDPKSILNHTVFLLKKADSLGYATGNSKTKLLQLKIYEAIGDSKKAIPIINSLLSFFSERNDINSQAEVYLLWSGVLKNSGKYTEALDKGQQANRLFTTTNNRIGAGRALINIGLVYYKLSEFPTCIKTNEAALKIFEAENDKIYIARVLNNLANVYADTENNEKALEFLNQSLEIKKELGDKNSIAKTYNNIGTIYQKIANKEKAIYYLNLSYQIKKELGDKVGMGTCLVNLGSVYYDLGEYDVCEKYFLDALMLFKEGNATDLQEIIHENLAEIYGLQKNYQKAYLHLSDALELKESLFGDKLSENIAEMQAKFEVEKAEETAEKEKIRREADNKTSKLVIASIALLVLLMSVVAIFLYKQSRLRKRANAKLEAQKQQIELKNHEIELKNKDITDSIRYAKHIQEAIVPPNEFIRKFLPDSFVLYLPKDIVAGDFYWVDEQINDNNELTVFFAVVDCTGHGVPGAMMSVVGANGLYRCVDEFKLRDPATILDKLSFLVEDGFKRGGNEINDGMDISLCKLHLPKQHATVFDLSWAGANNPLWIIKNNGDFIELTANKQPIGKFAHKKPFTPHHLQVEKGDTLYLFTDGYADQFGGPKGKKLKYAKLRDLLFSVRTLAVEEQKIKIHQFFEAWRGDLEQVDDVCLMGIRI